MFPRVVVIMSVYKSDNLLFMSDAVESILVQTINADLFIYVDGPVSNEIDDKLSYYEQYTNVYVFRNEENKGLAKGLNFLIDKALNEGYEYIARMDSDDISVPERLELQVKFMDSNPKIDFSGSFCKEFGASFALDLKRLPTSNEDIVNFSITRCPFVHPTVIFRRRIFESGQRYPENTVLTEDMALWFKLFEQGLISANIDFPLLHYRLNENTIYRRQGLSKAGAEVLLRVKYMIVLKRITFNNFVKIFSRIFFHLSPGFVIKLAYKRLR